MILNPSRLRRAVCDELAARQPEFEERYSAVGSSTSAPWNRWCGNARPRSAEIAVAKRASASAAAGNDSFGRRAALAGAQ